MTGNNSVATDFDNALQQYGIIASYLQYENSTFWTRTSLLLVAHTALFGFLAQVLPPISKVATWEKISISMVMGLTGIVLVLIWWTSIVTAERWINRWHNRLRKLEQTAFGEMRLFRESDNSANHFSARGIAMYLVTLYGILWGLSLLYCLMAVIAKCS